jgi:hypothetical protein
MIRSPRQENNEVLRVDWDSTAEERPGSSGPLLGNEQAAVRCSNLKLSEQSKFRACQTLTDMKPIASIKTDQGGQFIHTVARIARHEQNTTNLSCALL